MNTEELEDYLDGNLSATERTAFEARLAADPVLAADLSLLRELRQRVADLPAQQAFEQHLSEKLQQVGAAHFEKKSSAPGVRIFRLTPARLAIAASLALLACLGAWYFLSNQPLSDRQLVARFFEPPAALGAFRSAAPEPADGDVEALRKQVDSLYLVENYALALSLMPRLETTFEGQPSSDFFFQRGILHLLAGQPRQALADFALVQNGHFDEKQWYAAWAYLQAGERQAAKNLFEEIARSESPQSKQAAAVLSEML